MAKKLSTEAYKGTRDFYPEDMAIQRYIFDTWAKTAESFGFARYDASVLEPSELYRSKSVENEEIINDQTYSFTDRGEREVTLRPEMTPTVARMIAHKRRDLSFPVRWYSIPNLFRYERPQRGRLREHWQLNCDMFLPAGQAGGAQLASDIEMIVLAVSVLTAFGAKKNSFEVRVNDRALLNEIFEKEGFTHEQSNQMLALLDRKDKITNFNSEAKKIAGKPFIAPESVPGGSTLATIMDDLKKFDITAVYSPSTVRGFNYYTGTIFEIFDTDPKNNRSLIGGGRYDNLTSIFSDEKISGIGFGMGDVTMRDFLETHNLLKGKIAPTAPTLAILPMDESLNMESERIAHTFRTEGTSVAVDLSTKKVGKKISTASEAGSSFILVVGEDEVRSQMFTLKNLKTKEETKGAIFDLTQKIV